MSGATELELSQRHWDACTDLDFMIRTVERGVSIKGSTLYDYYNHKAAKADRLPYFHDMYLPEGMSCSLDTMIICVQASAAQIALVASAWIEEAATKYFNETTRLSTIDRCRTIQSLHLKSETCYLPERSTTADKINTLFPDNDAQIMTEQVRIFNLMLPHSRYEKTPEYLSDLNRLIQRMHRFEVEKGRIWRARVLHNIINSPFHPILPDFNGWNCTNCPESKDGRIKLQKGSASNLPMFKCDVCNMEWLCPDWYADFHANKQVYNLEWNTTDVKSLLEGIREGKLSHRGTYDHQQLAALADLLEEAGMQGKSCSVCHGSGRGWNVKGDWGASRIVDDSQLEAIGCNACNGTGRHEHAIARHLRRGFRLEEERKRQGWSNELPRRNYIHDLCPYYPGDWAIETIHSGGSRLS